MKKLAVILLLLFPMTLWGQRALNIWADVDSVRQQVYMQVFVPSAETATGEAVLILPGGSYHWLDLHTEGEDVARRLAGRGIAAFVLHYRTAGVGYFLFRDLAIPRPAHYPDMYDDVLRALEIIRFQPGVASAHIGVMGFSAGGHLALYAGEHAQPRPAFIVAVYPVVTMSEEEIVHRRSRRGLLGRTRRDAGRRAAMSVEKGVPEDMPKTFLVVCEDDPVVDPENAARMDEALTRAGIPHEYQVFPNGGHGFGATDGPAGEHAWFESFIGWLRKE